MKLLITYKNEINEINKLKEILQDKYKILEEKYEKLSNENNINKQKYIDKLSIINSNINELIINEKFKYIE